MCHQFAFIELLCRRHNNKRFINSDPRQNHVRSRPYAKDFERLRRLPVVVSHRHQEEEMTLFLLAGWES